MIPVQDLPKNDENHWNPKKTHRIITPKSQKKNTWIHLKWAHGPWITHRVADLFPPKKNKTPQTIPPPKVNFHQVDKTYANLRFCAGAIVSLGGWTFLDGWSDPNSQHSPVLFSWFFLLLIWTKECLLKGCLYKGGVLYGAEKIPSNILTKNIYISTKHF